LQIYPKSPNICNLFQEKVPWKRQHILKPKECSFMYELFTDNAWGWGRSLAGTAGSDTAGIMDVTEL